MPGNVLLQDRRVFVPGEFTLRLAPGLAGHHADIAPREQGLETGDVAGEKARFDHPEDRLIGQQRLGFMGGGDGHDDMRVIRRELEALDRAEDDVPELELRLAGLQPFAAVEGDPYRRPLLRPCVPGEPGADRDRDQRDHPNDRYAPRAPGPGARDGCPLLGDITHSLTPLGVSGRFIPGRNVAPAAVRVNPSPAFLPRSSLARMVFDYVFLAKKPIGRVGRVPYAAGHWRPGAGLRTTGRAPGSEISRRKPTARRRKGR